MMSDSQIIPNLPMPNSRNWGDYSQRRKASENWKAEAARRSLHSFVAQAWHILEPATPFIDGLVVRSITEHLQAISENRIGNLAVAVPPGSGKSLLAAVFW